MPVRSRPAALVPVLEGQPVVDGSRAAVRPEIQALRAVAVLAVVLFHLWPGRLPGGYVGVDIFFAISGFLITSHIAREIDRRGTVSLSAFWARRIRRLLPAALLVLLVSAAAVFAVMPRTQWTQDFREILASSFYFENWRLAADAVNYLAAENSASTVQHYWSLSVEEQFYVIWPLALLGALLLARPLTLRPRRVMAAVLGVAFLASLGYSVWETAHSPGPAYFVTPVRVWQFAAGGLLALWVPTPPSWLSTRWRLVLLWTGGLALAVSILKFSTSTPFPGYAAALPVFGALAVMLAGLPEHPVALPRLVTARPVQFVGDLSYSLYLWHWPLVVALPFVLGRAQRDLVISLVILVASLVLAALTKRFVEDPLRASNGPLGRRRSAYCGAAVGMAAVAAVAVGGLMVTSHELDQGAERAREIEASGATGCFGAGAFLSASEPCNDPKLVGTVLPDLAALASDTGGAFSCYDQHPDESLQKCHFGSRSTNALRVALVGDSHGAQLLPGLRTQLNGLNWSFDAYVGRGCNWMEPHGECQAHQSALQKRFENGERYDLIIVTARRNPNLGRADRNPDARYYSAAWKPVLERGTKIVAVADNPMLTDRALACITGSQSAADVRRCAMSRSAGFQNSDPLEAAVRMAGRGAALVDMSDAYCSADICPMVVGSVIPYRDRDHLTATFSRTLAPFLVEAIQKAAGLARK